MEFLKSFLDLLLYPQPEYTIYNTLLYALEFVFFAYLIFILLKRARIRIDFRLVISISPFIIFGSSLRVLVDAGILALNFYATPLNYILIGFLSFTTISTAILIERKFKIPYFKTAFLAGFPLAFIPLLILIQKIINLYGSLLVFLFILPWLFLMYISRWKKENKIVFSIHVFDATTTFVSIKYFNYLEMHVLPNIFIKFFGPFSFVLIKAVAVALILFTIDRYCKDRELKKYIKFLIGILGAATGIRDFLRLLALT